MSAKGEGKQWHQKIIRKGVRYENIVQVVCLNLVQISSLRVHSKETNEINNEQWNYILYFACYNQYIQSGGSVMYE